RSFELPEHHEADRDADHATVERHLDARIVQALVELSQNLVGQQPCNDYRRGHEREAVRERAECSNVERPPGPCTDVNTEEPERDRAGEWNDHARPAFREYGEGIWQRGFAALD